MSWSVEREREKERYDNLSNIFLPPYMVGVTFGIEFKNLELNRKQEESLFFIVLYLVITMFWEVRQVATCALCSLH